MSLKEIIVLGSLHYDIFLESSDLPRIGETVKGKKWYPKLGGKGGNQAIAASFYSVPVKLISAVGKDDFGNFILENLEKKHINIEYVQVLENVNSGMSVAISNSEGDYGAVIISGANQNIKTYFLNDNNLWKNVEFLMLQNEIDESTNILAAKKAKECGSKVFYNAAPAKKINSDLFKFVDIILVNTIEAQDLTKVEIKNLQDIKIASKILTKNIPTSIISVGGEGVVFCEIDNEPIHFKGINVNVKSTHGAGDTFAGTFCSALVSGSKVIEAIEIANRKAAEFVSI